MAPIRDEELLLRWAEYSAFTPMMRTHETNRPAENVQIYDNVELLQKFGRLTRIFKELKPYIKNAVAQNANEGTPVMRPLFLQYQDDPEAFDQDYQYMFGDDLLVAPVLEPGVENWNVYLPGKGELWKWLWDRLEAPYYIDGGQYITVFSPLGYPPVFYRHNSTFKDLFEKISIDFQP